MRKSSDGEVGWWLNIDEISIFYSPAWGNLIFWLSAIVNFESLPGGGVFGLPVTLLGHLECGFCRLHPLALSTPWWYHRLLVGLSLNYLFGCFVWTSSPGWEAEWIQSWDWSSGIHLSFLLWPGRLTFYNVAPCQFHFQFWISFALLAKFKQQHNI